jgi:hypothetical protein
MPPPRGKDPTIVFAEKYDPTSDDLNPHGVESPNWLHWVYRNSAELAALEARFDREFGPATRGPNDPPCLFVKFTDTTEFSEERQLQGTHLEHGAVAS